MAFALHAALDSTLTKENVLHARLTILIVLCVQVLAFVLNVVRDIDLVFLTYLNHQKIVIQFQSVPGIIVHNVINRVIVHNAKLGIILTTANAIVAVILYKVALNAQVQVFALNVVKTIDSV